MQKEEEGFRDFPQQMRMYVQAVINGQSGQFTHTGLAHEIVNWLREHDPELLRGWLDVQAADLLRQYIGTMTRSERSHQRVKAGRKAFGDAVDRHAAGDPTALTDFLSQPYLIDESNARLPLGKMNRNQLDFAANDYQRRADTNAFEAQFLRALGKKVGDGTVEDFFTEEKICKMRNSLSRLFAAA